MKKLQLFDQNHGLSPLEKCQFCLLFKSIFISSRKACFPKRTAPNTFSRSIQHKKKRSQNFKSFDQNNGLTPFEKCQFWGFFKPMFSLFRKACLLYKRSKIVFHDLLSRSITWEYRGLTGVTTGYRGLQGVTECYTELRGITGGYQGL